MEEIKLKSNDTITFSKGGNIIAVCDTKITEGQPVILINKYFEYPIMEDKFVVRGIEQS